MHNPPRTPDSDPRRSDRIRLRAVAGCMAPPGGARSAGPAGTAVAGPIAGDLAGIVFDEHRGVDGTWRHRRAGWLGSIFAEKSGVINIGLEGLLIISAFVSVYVASVVGIGNAVLGVPAIWVGFCSPGSPHRPHSGVFGIVCTSSKPIGSSPDWRSGSSR